VAIYGGGVVRCFLLYTCVRRGGLMLLINFVLLIKKKKDRV
jgi:hypothetical protein